jgi:hypothetical protein
MKSGTVKKVVFYFSIVMMIMSLSYISYFAFLYLNAPPRVAFDYKQTASPEEEIVFNNTSSVLDPSLQWIWDFGDQSEQVNSLNASHSYPVPGRFVVTLSLQMGDEVYTRQNIIQISMSSPKSAFDIEASSIAAGDTLKISNNSQNATDFIWLLGDGRTSTDQYPMIYYPQPGEYELKLIAVNQLGQMDEYVLNVSIQPGVNSSAGTDDTNEDEVIVRHIPIFDSESLADAFNSLANVGMSRSEKRRVRNDILRDVASIEILVDELTLENYLNKIQLEASNERVAINILEIERDANNKISRIKIN